MKNEDEIESLSVPVTSDSNTAGVSNTGDLDLSKFLLVPSTTDVPKLKKCHSVRVSKPRKTTLFRVNEKPGFSGNFYLLDIEAENQLYIVTQAVAVQFPGECIPKTLFTVIDRQNNVSLWPVKLPGTDGRLDDYNRSAFEAAGYAKTQWVRICANPATRVNDISLATGKLPEPTWPEQAFFELIQIAFKDRFIKEYDHPALRKMRGEI